VQVVGIPIAEDHVAHLTAVAEQLRAHQIRVDVDAGDDRMQRRSVPTPPKKVPFLLLAGATTSSPGAVSFRFRDGGQINGVPVADAVAAIVSWIERRENDSPTEDALRSVLA